MLKVLAADMMSDCYQAAATANGSHEIALIHFYEIEGIAINASTFLQEGQRILFECGELPFYFSGLEEALLEFELGVHVGQVLLFLGGLIFNEYLLHQDLQQNGKVLGP